MALRGGVVENKHISGKNSPRRKKKCPQRSPDVQWESTGTEKKSVIMQSKRMGCHECALTRLSPYDAWRKSVGLFRLRHPEDNLEMFRDLCNFTCLM